MNASAIPPSPREPQAWTPATIKALRKRLGINVRQLAALVGISASAVWQWERDERHPSDDTAYRLRLLTPESVRCLERFTPPPPDLVVSVHRLAQAFGFTITIPAKADKRWLMDEHARLTALRTRLYGQLR